MDGSYTHGNQIVTLNLNVYGSPSDTYYYFDGLLQFLHQKEVQLNDAKVCLVKIKMHSGTEIMVLVVEVFLATAPTTEAMN